MSRQVNHDMEWTTSTLVVGFLVSVAGLLLALALKEMSVWPRWDYSEVVFGALCGATAVHSRHRQRPLAVLFIFMPVMTALLWIVGLLFYVYVLGNPIDL